MSWESNLPGGNRRSRPHNCVTILDCIFNTNVFYVLDILQWGEIPLVDSEVSKVMFL